jgi:hypothetical protein
LLTTARPDALYLLGRIARAEGRIDDAITMLEAAREAHRKKRQAKELAKDAGELALAHLGRNQLAEALRLIDECITQANLAAKPDVQLYCHLIAAQTLIRAGYWPAADQELALAAQLSTSRQQRSDLAYQRGNHAQERGEHATAIAFFREAMAYRVWSPNTTWTVNVELNLAYSLAERGELAKANDYLEAATVLDFEGEKARERAQTAARIAYHQHDLARAAALNETYIYLRNQDDDASDRDDLIDVVTLQARIELERDNLGSAERWARHGVQQAELVRDEQSALELRPWVLVKRRAPYELLFTALARGGQVESAAMVFNDWQGRTAQDVLATPRSTAALDHRGMADRISRLGDWLSVASSAAFAPSADPATVLSAMRGIDLLALIVADGEVWRLTASHGPLRLVRIASLADLQEPLNELRMHPTDRELATQLGMLLVPKEAFHTREVLHVVLDSRLAALPVAALRRGGAPLIVARPIVRGLRLPERRCVHARRPGHATVLGVDDPKIPNATAEADQVAELLHTTSATGAAATRAALFAAASDSVLHVAAHATIGVDGAALVLADGEASALEISARRVGPALAVLSACDAAVSDDGELGGSLVAAFLGAGTRHVVATLRPVSDAGTRDLITRFYRARGVADPARALAAVQAELSTTDNAEWPYFAVFGPQVCRDGVPDLE